MFINLTTQHRNTKVRVNTHYIKMYYAKHEQGSLVEMYYQEAIEVNQSPIEIDALIQKMNAAQTSIN